MSTPYNVRHTLPNPIMAGSNPQLWMARVRILAVVSICDQEKFADQMGTDHVGAAINRWIPILSTAAYNGICDAASMTADPDGIFDHSDELAHTIQGLIAQQCERYGLTVQEFRFESFDRPASPIPIFYLPGELS